MKEERNAILFVGPMVDWRNYLWAIKEEGFVAVAVIAEDFCEGAMMDFTPFAALSKVCQEYL